MLRLRKKHEAAIRDPTTVPDPRALIASQSVAGALAGGVVAIGLMLVLWTVVTDVTGRVFPWFSILQGPVIGLFVRRFGRGFDYRFPLIAAALSCTGSLIGNLVIALPETIEQLDATAWQVVRGLTWRTFEIFFDEVVTAVDYIYAGFAAALAAFYSRRRLNRHEEFALRTMHERLEE